MSFCAIDFGTSNSAVAVPGGANSGAAMRLVELEAGYGTLPTAVFFNADEGGKPSFGRSAITHYVDGFDGRLMRSLKSLLGSSLIESTTDIGNGSAMRYIDVIGTFLRHLRQHALRDTGGELRQVVMGRPVFFVDDDPGADAAAQRSLEQSARDVGFTDVQFQFEPIAAAFDYESRLDHEQQVLVIDIGGGTSDFSLVRVGPARAQRLERKDDVLAHHGVHVAGTDFDRRIELATLLRELGYKSLGPDGKEVPNRIYFDLATWHLINTIYTPKRVAELSLMGHLYAEQGYHRRLMRTVEDRLGHALVGLAEDAKIAVADGGQTRIDLSLIERALDIAFSEEGLKAAVEDEIGRIVDAARHTASLGGLRPEQVDALYFTGGSTGLRCLSGALAAAFPNAKPVFGDRLASVALGLGIHARRVFA
ncbi:heat-shock protein [Pandoraea terrae]|uniref:Heat-shock protein n=1 Tax=Pandoraea terrae TaxID=1537710 RepID=A0A5E4RE33_9BURK|nr:Hsp70 family protein [Pandoraea terrae]VVD60744.1 heat-shock protein [Pandoraea terrae]